MYWLIIALTWGGSAPVAVPVQDEATCISESKRLDRTAYVQYTLCVKSSDEKVRP
ncbi:hypothetical protein [Vibrio phage vB_VpP_DE10]|uniref:Uncharacterized protein n=3 Tax=Maculvirus TaxID=2731958 RepID=A0AAE8B1X8_9CAUD|nr:hypothetical protein [Vibrio phage vB_VpP_DE17]QWY13596.1 hypothetical protein [Vibrio phage vB_VpP_DE18]QXV72197.1 hypothetical protein [Vibrio phage vB_VpP_DE10]